MSNLEGKTGAEVMFYFYWVYTRMRCKLSRTRVHDGSGRSRGGKFMSAGRARDRTLPIGRLGKGIGGTSCLSEGECDTAEMCRGSRGEDSLSD